MALFPTKQPYDKYRQAKKEHNETGDCSVTAMAFATDKSYTVCHAACKRHGRKHRKGFAVDPYRKSFNNVGFKTVPVPLDSSKGASLSAQIPLLSRDTVYVIWVTNHYLCYRDGKWLDHSPINGRRIQQIWRIEPI